MDALCRWIRGHLDWHDEPAGYRGLFAISESTGLMQGGVPSIGQYVQVTGTCAAADDVLDPPDPPTVLPGLDNVRAGGTLGASCGAPVSTLQLADFGRSVDQLCDALGGCPAAGTVNSSARLVASSSQTVPPGGTLLDQGTLVFSGGSGSFTDPLRLDASGTTFTAGLDVGPGDHVVRLCSTLATVTGC